MDSQKAWFDSLYLQCSPKMVSIAMRAGLTAEEAEGIAQDASYSSWSRLPRSGNRILLPPPIWSPYCGTCLERPCGDAERKSPTEKCLNKVDE